MPEIEKILLWSGFCIGSRGGSLNKMPLSPDRAALSSG
jgi:hypothetical protein